MRANAESYALGPTPDDDEQFAEEAFTLARSSGGDVLCGLAHDWLLQYAPGDFGILFAQLLLKLRAGLFDQGRGERLGEPDFVLAARTDALRPFFGILIDVNQERLGFKAE